MLEYQPLNQASRYGKPVSSLKPKTLSPGQHPGPLTASNTWLAPLGDRPTGRHHIWVVYIQRMRWEMRFLPEVIDYSVYGYIFEPSPLISQVLSMLCALVCNPKLVT